MDDDAGRDVPSPHLSDAKRGGQAVTTREVRVIRKNFDMSDRTAERNDEVVVGQFTELIFG